MFLLAFQRILFQLILDILYFPLWWYGVGLRRVMFGLFHMLQDANASLAPGLWLRNIFTPMYGQTDFQGRLMSFFMRLVNIIGGLFALIVYLFALVVMLCLWLTVPVAIIYMMMHVVLVQ